MSHISFTIISLRIDRRGSLSWNLMTPCRYPTLHRSQAPNRDSAQPHLHIQTFSAWAMMWRWSLMMPSSDSPQGVAVSIPFSTVGSLSSAWSSVFPSASPHVLLYMTRH